jgi:hypothetical protein
MFRSQEADASHHIDETRDRIMRPVPIYMTVEAGVKTRPAESAPAQRYENIFYQFFVRF